MLQALLEQVADIHMKGYIKRMMSGYKGNSYVCSACHESVYESPAIVRARVCSSVSACILVSQGP